MTNSDDEPDLETEVREMLLDAKRRRVTGISFLYITGPGVLRQLPKEIARFDWLKSIDLEGTCVSDLSLLSGLTRLQNLDMRSSAVTDLSPLAGMTDMREIYMEGAPVSDLSPLSGLKRLRELWLDHTLVTDLSPLAGCSALQKLSLRSTKVSDLSPLAGLPNLCNLTLDDTQVLDLKPLLRLPAFCKEFDMNVGISFENTPATARSKALERIATEFGDEGRRASDLLEFLTAGGLDGGWYGNA